ncbi:hypothetical protein [Pseudoxanthomonas winnipegensis]|uniref:Uncharacterized protein n=1 Tax=Pseudoxanthomonas winnipegensis TaxID=2480810 RepID=A0A4V2HFX5_9GAMM|nr:hypothetical protein [Pseudoxanthomonas winnipegensis]TAA41576.1 hypothetical protein EA655_11590 [Pseudoxanthomonas winnipegensis]
MDREITDQQKGGFMSTDDGFTIDRNGTKERMYVPKWGDVDAVVAAYYPELDCVEYFESDEDLELNVMPDAVVVKA